MQSCPWPCQTSRFLLQDVEQRSGDITYGQFAQLYRSLMFSAQKMVRAGFCRAGKGRDRPWLLLPWDREEGSEEVLALGC